MKKSKFDVFADNVTEDEELEEPDLEKEGLEGLEELEDEEE